MSDLGPLSYGEKNEPVFLGRDFHQRVDYSPDTAIRIDEQVSQIVTEGHQTATQILTDHRDVLERIARDLLEHESLDGAHVYEVIENLTGKNLRPKRTPIVMPKPVAPEPVPVGQDVRQDARDEERASASETVGRRAREAAEKAVRGARDKGDLEDEETSPEVAAAQRRARPSEPGELQDSKGSR
jgi:hypothetical protein